MTGAFELGDTSMVSACSGGANPKALRTQTWTYDIASSTNTAQGQAQTVADLLRQVATATAQLVTTTPR